MNDYETHIDNIINQYKTRKNNLPRIRKYKN